MADSKSALQVHIDNKVAEVLKWYNTIANEDGSYINRSEGKTLISGILGAYRDLRSVLRFVQQENQELRRRLQELEDRLPEKIGRDI